jgi:hypothetical protein
LFTDLSGQPWGPIFSGQGVPEEIPTKLCVTTQESEDLIYTAAEARSLSAVLTSESVHYTEVWFSSLIRKLSKLFYVTCYYLKGKVTPKQAYVALRGPGG